MDGDNHPVGIDIGAITLTPTLCSLMLRLDKKYNLFQKMVSNPFDAFLKKVTDAMPRFSAQPCAIAGRRLPSS